MSHGTAENGRNLGVEALKHGGSEFDPLRGKSSVDGLSDIDDHSAMALDEPHADLEVVHGPQIPKLGDHDFLKHVDSLLS